MSLHDPTTDQEVEALLGQIAEEYTERLNRGEEPSIEEYLNRYPDCAEQLKKMLAMVEELHRTKIGHDLPRDDSYLKEPLGDFQLIRKIGQGGMGVVFLAEQISVHRRKVAVKLLPSASAMDSRMIERFKNEAHAAGCLQHENIVPVYSVGCERGQHFYAMQYIVGLTLEAIIKKLRSLAGQKASSDPDNTAAYVPSPGEKQDNAADTTPLSGLTTEDSTHSPQYFDIIAQLGIQAAKGLDHAHQLYVIHRDIKPANLMVDSRNNLWITDFGLAQIRDNNLTIPGQLFGTLRYMSPEQALANRIVVDHRTDIYSLGATLYELLTLKPVVDGVGRAQILSQITFEDPKPPRRENHHIPRDLETIVLTALAKSPDRRYSTAKEMAEDLQRFLDREPIKARPEGWLRWIGRNSRRNASQFLTALSIVMSMLLLILLILNLQKPVVEHKPTPEEIERKNQEESLAAHNRNLDDKKSVTLIGKTGRPGYFRLMTDENAAKTVIGPEEEFTVQNWDYGLVELLPDPRKQSFLFRAEVRHERQAHQESRVGIYFAHSQHQDDKKSTIHLHYTVAINDLVDVAVPVNDEKGAPKGNPVWLQAHRHLSGGRVDHDKANLGQPATYFRPAKPVGALGPWHEIAVEVRAKTIKVSWKDSSAVKPLEKLFSRAMIREQAGWLTNVPNFNLPPNIPIFSSGGGLGLYVSLGVASFRNVTVEPLDP